MGAVLKVAMAVGAVIEYLDERSANGDELPEGALQRAADALGVDLESDDEDSFGKTSSQMRRWLHANRNWVDHPHVKLVRQWEENVGVLEADASRYQDVCDALQKAGFPVDHASGQDAHQVVERILLERTPNPDQSEYARGFEAGVDYERGVEDASSEVVRLREALRVTALSLPCQNPQGFHECDCGLCPSCRARARIERIRTEGAFPKEDQ